MAFCGNCGAKMEDGAKFCPACGQGAGMSAAAQAEQAPAQPQVQPQPQAATAVQNFVNTADSTAGFDANDIAQNKAMAILAYIIVLIPIFAAKESKFARYHSNQGLILVIAAIAYGVAASVLTGILTAISWRLGLAIGSILNIGYLAVSVLAVIGIINAVQGKAKELPLIGKFRLLK